MARPRLHIDIETRSRVDLKKYGVYRYVRCPDFRILMASWSLDGSPIRTALSYPEIHEIPGLFDNRVTKVAHNAAFERVCFGEFMRREVPSPDWDYERYTPIISYDDTQARAAALGYPKSLAKLAIALGVSPKDEAGTRLINLFSKPNRQGGWNGPETHPMDWLDFIFYCEQDVATLAEIDEQLGDFPTETERAVYHADQHINDRGIRIDLDLAREAVRSGHIITAEQKQRVRDLTGVENPGSTQQLHTWLESVDSDLLDLRAETVETALRGDLSPDVREVLELRQELALAAPAKFASALAGNVNGRLHGAFAYFGAHTGRWAGRGTQPHNLPRLGFTYTNASGKERHCEVDQELAIQQVLSGGLVSAEDLKRLVRPLFLGPMTVVDYAAIEARVIAWLAGEEWVLQAARDGRDLYVETAERMGGLTRAQGKIAVLALGYNGGPDALRRMAAPEDEVLRLEDEDLYDTYVYPWRNANSRTVHLWGKLERAFRSGGPAGDHIHVERDGNDRLVRLPSGRAICYRKCGIQKRKKLNRWTGEYVEREVLTFWSPQGRRVETYGGKLAENVTQAVARDLLAEALVRLEQRGYPVVLHVHDEIGVEGEHDVDTIAKIMAELPEWAAGLPVEGEGFVCQRYRKG